MKLLRWLGGLLALIGGSIYYGTRLRKTREKVHDIRRTADRRREELWRAEKKAAYTGDTSRLRDELLKSLDEDN